MRRTIMKKTLTGVALVIVTALAASACTTRETRIIQPAVAVPAAPAGTTVIVPERDPDIIVDID
jgi:hypothetical protein